MMNLSAPRESRRGQLYNSPQISHTCRIEKSIKKNDRVYLNYLGSDISLSTIYRALVTNTKVYKLSGCAETLSLNYYVLCK